MRRKLLVVGWDAADWNLLHPLLDLGEMPALGRVVESGASGRLLCTLPVVPAIQWTSLATGKRAWQHGVCHARQIAGNGRTEPIDGRHRRSPAIWEILAQKGLKSVVVGWPAAHGLTQENLVSVSDRYPEPTAGPGIRPWPPALGGTYSSGKIGERLDSLRVSPEDIQSDILSLYVPQWNKIDQKRDRRLGQLRLFLAADFSYQKAIVELLEKETWDFAAVRFPALGAISPVFLPFNLPRRDGVSQEDFDLFRGVMRGAYQMLDRMLHQLVSVAGPNSGVLVVSGHGVRTDVLPNQLRADPEAWKSAYGIFAASGPGFAPDALVHGASVLDVTPTLLTWFGLPIGEDMEGRVLIESFSTPPPVDRVESWAPVNGLTPPTDPAAPANALERESDWNLAQSYLEAARYDQAHALLDRLFRAFPERTEVGSALVRCQMALGLLAEAEETLEVVLEGVAPGVASLIPRAELALEKRDYQQARRMVDEALGLNSSHPVALRRLGILLLKLRDWDSLALLAKRALALDENDALAWLGLAAAQLRKGLPLEASESAMRAIGLNYFMPDAHFILARSFVAQGKWTEGREALQTLIRMQPTNRAASAYFKRVAGR